MLQASKQESLNTQAERQLMNYLEKVPFISCAQVLMNNNDNAADLLFKVDIAGQPQYLAVVVKKNGQPLIATEAFYRLRSALATSLANYPVFMAPYISPRVAEMCQQAGVGYADFAGNCFLSFDSVYLKREQFPNPMIERRKSRSLFTRKATDIYRVLLCKPREKYTLSQLAKVAMVSLGQVHNVLEMLINHQWMQRVANGVKLTEPELLLRTWAQKYSLPAHERYEYYTEESLATIERQLAFCAEGKSSPAVLTGFSGAERYAPYTRYQRVHAWIAGDIELLTQSLGLKAVNSGANVICYLPKENSIFFDLRQVNEACVVSPIQLYLDLIAIGGRGIEAAEHLFETEIKTSW